MKIEHRNITVRDLVDGYADDGEGGVRGFGGNLDIRPAYQREFVYKDKQRNAVIETVRKSYPLNVMYWVDREDGTYEVMDGQQRTISISQFVAGDFSLDFQFFHNLTDDERDAILDYELSVYVCRGTDSEKLDWFRTINIAGEKLTDQELRNAVYPGPWLASAKTWFSRSGCPATKIGDKLVSGSSIRQEYLARALEWASHRDATERARIVAAGGTPKVTLADGSIESYMAIHQHDANANDLWGYFQSVVEWANMTFPKYRREMKGVDWGFLYEKYGKEVLDTDALEKRVVDLMIDDDVTKKSGIFPFVLGEPERNLSIRAFTPAMKRSAYEKQKGICPDCKEHFEIEKMDGDHVVPWSKGGTTTADNLVMRCGPCNKAWSNR